MKIRVYYEDTDLGGIVYHANYLKFIERARSEHFFTLGIKPFDDRGQFVIRKMISDWLAPTTLGDILDITTTTLLCKGASVTLLQEIYLVEKKVFSAELVLVYLTNDKKVSKIPQDIREIFNAYK
jgi:acyl-CoA thioester hydrolase